MPFLRLTRDSHGYETTCLLHASRPGEEPRVLYWYRTAPGVRVGRLPLDEDAIRTIEERHPEIEFDWPHILEVGATLSPEVERRPERPRRRPRAPEDPAVVTAAAPDPQAPAPDAVSSGREAAVPSRREAAVEPAAPPPPRPRSSLLDELVGREIAARLRERYAEIAARVREVADASQRATWQARSDALDPDGWVSPEAILHGVQHADRLFDELRRELP